MRLCLFALMLLSGCSSVASLQLDPRWRPLERVEESSFPKADVFMTIAPNLLCNNLSDFTGATPDQQESLLTHEHIHAVRQLSYGGGQAGWLLAYASDARFRWQEESLAWTAEFTWRLQHGYPINAPAWAALMCGPTYTILGVPMISYQDALDWLSAFK